MNTTNSEQNRILSEFAGWGEVHLMDDLSESKHLNKLDQEEKNFLSEWPSTALCGNDITSSCLYVAGLSILQAGILAPVVLALVGVTLYFFRKIYAEVGSALPLNGGTYTLLLNTTTKKRAAAVACLTLLSYIATGVISANEAIHYIKVIFSSLPVDFSVILLLSLFALLAILGVGESAKVALGIFILHISTLAFLILSGLWHLSFNPEVMLSNLKYGMANMNLGPSLLFGFSVALLGISGFESSANFIEEQKPGVFPKTLRNMWLAIFIINPLVAVIGLGMVSIDQSPNYGEGFLAHLGEVAVGPWFASWIAIDAFLVLSGAVLTSFVGVLGLVRRMALDRCLPPFLLIENKWRNTNHWIVLLFLAVCISIYFVTGGKTTELAGVYTLSFLSVMSFFAIGNALLKVKRGRLPRDEVAPWSYIFFALTLVIIGIIGNILLNPRGSIIFLTYYAAALTIVMVLLLRTPFLRFILQGISQSVQRLSTSEISLQKKLSNWIYKINNVPVLYFSKGDNLPSLNEAALYVQRNEQTKLLTICHVYEDPKTIPKTLIQQVKVIDQIYPKLKIDLLLVKGKFTPLLVEAISKKTSVAKNRMFIGSPGGNFIHRIEEFGGVRVVLSGDGL